MLEVCKTDGVILISIEWTDDFVVGKKNIAALVSKVRAKIQEFDKYVPCDPVRWMQLVYLVLEGQTQA